MSLNFPLYIDGTRETEKNYSDGLISITETVINGFFTVDLHWTVLSWNEAAGRLLGVLAKNIIGKNLWDEFAPILPLNFYSLYHTAILQDIPVHFKQYWVEKDAWFDVITYYSNDTLSVSFKRSEQLPPVNPQRRLEILNEVYRFVTEVTNDCLWELDIQRRELFWIDGGHKRLFGYNIENALVSQNFWETCLHPDDKERVTDKLFGILSKRGTNTWEEEYRFRRADGQYSYVHDRGHIIYRHGMPARMIGATQDITDRKLTESRLIESETKLSLIARQTVNAVIITDVGEKILWVNDAFTHITEYTPEEVIGKKPGNFLQGAETDYQTIRYLREKMKRLEPFDCEIVNYTKSGRRYWIHIQGQPMLDSNGNCERFFAIETDITEKKLLEDKLKEERITKQEEITDAVLSAQEYERSDIGKELHDNVNQILGATKLYIDMARADNEKKDIYLDEACLHLMNSIEEIRKISKRLIPQSMSLIGLADSIKILVDDLREIHMVNIQFNDEGIEEIDMDEKMKLNIFRIVQEQVNNILKHSSAVNAVITLKKHKNEILLCISDNGKGCDLTKKTTGVGVRNILSRVELYHGQLSIKSKPGKGYSLNVVFPLGAAVPLNLTI